ncbi:MAG: SH3 domain-containing protein [Spirochaetales bacterium]|nr:SH3 domain-containing protein [Spirochaetales bacterium]
MKVIILFFALPWIFLNAETLPDEWAYINEDAVRLRRGSNLEAEVIMLINRNEPVWVAAKSDKMQKIGGMNAYWYRIKTFENTNGWVYGYFLTFSAYEQYSDLVQKKLHDALLINEKIKAPKSKGNLTEILLIENQWGSENRGSGYSLELSPGGRCLMKPAGIENGIPLNGVWKIENGYLLLALELVWKDRKLANMGVFSVWNLYTEGSSLSRTQYIRPVDGGFSLYRSERTPSPAP